MKRMRQFILEDGLRPMNVLMNAIMTEVLEVEKEYVDNLDRRPHWAQATTETLV